MRQFRSLVSIALVIMAFIGWPAVALSQTAPGDGGVTINRNPGDILDGLLQGPQITEPNDDTGDQLPGLMAAGVAALFLALNALIPSLDYDFNLDELLGLGDGSDTPGGVANRAILTEIANDGDNSFVEITNGSGLRLDLDDWAFCIDVDSRDCQTLSGLLLEADETLVLQLGGDPEPDILDQFLFLEVVSSQGELALYNFGTLGELDPSNSSAMEAYITWGPQLLNPTQLQNVALDAARWQRLDTLSPDSGLRDIAIQLNAGSLTIGGRDANDYTIVEFSNNTLGSPTVGSQDSSAGGDDDRSRSAFTRRRR